MCISFFFSFYLKTFWIVFVCLLLLLFLFVFSGGVLYLVAFVVVLFRSLCVFLKFIVSCVVIFCYIIIYSFIYLLIDS